MFQREARGTQEGCNKRVKKSSKQQSNKATETKDEEGHKRGAKEKKRKSREDIERKRHP